MLHQEINTNELIQALKSDPEKLRQQPEPFQTKVLELLASIDQRLKKMEDKWMKPLIK
jgi:hypothetical protein